MLTTIYNININMFININILINIYIFLKVLYTSLQRYFDRKS
jgi:hypothetical protein